MGLVDCIDGHYANQLNQHENDFKRAYKDQMKKVRQELEYLKMKQNEAVGALMNDDRITNLRKWIHWFKMKALELDAQLNQQKQSHVKQKIDQSDKIKSEAFLKNAVKESMKQNKALQAAAIRQKQQNDKLRAFFLKNNIPLDDKKSTKTTAAAASDIVAVASE